MVKQRNIFEPQRIDILTDSTDRPQEAITAKQVIEAHNQGLKVIIKPRAGKPLTEAPLFGQVNAKQTNLF